MSERGSRSARFIGKTKNQKFKKGKMVANATDVLMLETLFKRWKSKPYSPAREKALGNLANQIHKAKEHLKGVDKYSYLKRL